MVCEGMGGYEKGMETQSGMSIYVKLCLGSFKVYYGMLGFLCLLGYVIVC